MVEDAVIEVDWAGVAEPVLMVVVAATGAVLMGGSAENPMDEINRESERAILKWFISPPMMWW